MILLNEKYAYITKYQLSTHMLYIILNYYVKRLYIYIYIYIYIYVIIITYCNYNLIVTSQHKCYAVYI